MKIIRARARDQYISYMAVDFVHTEKCPIFRPIPFFLAHFLSLLPPKTSSSQTKTLAEYLGCRQHKGIYSIPSASTVTSQQLSTNQRRRIFPRFWIYNQTRGEMRRHGTGTSNDTVATTCIVYSHPTIGRTLAATKFAVLIPLKRGNKSLPSKNCTKQFLDHFCNRKMKEILVKFLAVCSMSDGRDSIWPSCFRLGVVGRAGPQSCKGR